MCKVDRCALEQTKDGKIQALPNLKVFCPAVKVNNCNQNSLTAFLSRVYVRLKHEQERRSGSNEQEREKGTFDKFKYHR